MLLLEELDLKRDGFSKQSLLEEIESVYADFEEKLQDFDSWNTDTNSSYEALETNSEAFDEQTTHWKPFYHRCFLPMEHFKIGTEGIGTLISLEEIGLITPKIREQVMDAIQRQNGQVGFEQLLNVVATALVQQGENSKFYNLLHFFDAHSLPHLIH